jgi:hypothetical protein
MDVEIQDERIEEGIAVTVRVRLSGRETNRLFLSGDTLVQLPLDGALPDEATPIPRTSIFLSELAGLRDGYRRVFRDTATAATYAAALRTQLSTALEGT